MNIFFLFCFGSVESIQPKCTQVDMSVVLNKEKRKDLFFLLLEKCLKQCFKHQKCDVL